MRHGYSAKTPQHIVLGAGALYTGFVSPDSLGTLLGATRGGSVFNYTPEVTDIGFDGSPGKVKGMQWVTGAVMTLEVNLLEVTTAILKMAAPGLTLSDYPASEETNSEETKEYDLITGCAQRSREDQGASGETKEYDLITGSFEIDSTEYQNIALVADIKGKTDPLIIVLKNALSNSPLSLNFQPKDNLVQAITFEGHFDGTDLEEMPFEIYNPIDVT